MNISPNLNRVQEFLQEIYHKGYDKSLSLKDRFALFFKTVRLSSNLIDTATHTYSKNSIKGKIEDISFLIKGMLNPLHFLPSKGSAQFLELQLTEEISKQVEELTHQPEFDDFISLKQILRGEQVHPLPEMIQKLKMKYQPELSDEQLAAKIFSELERVAKNHYLIDDETIVKLQHERALRHISQSLRSLEKVEALSQEQINRQNLSQFQLFTKLNPVYISTRVLAEMSSTPHNQQFLTKAWNHLLEVTGKQVIHSKTAEEHDRAIIQYDKAYRALSLLSEQANGGIFREVLEMHQRSSNFIGDPAHRLTAGIKPSYQHQELESHEIEQLRRLSKILIDLRVHPTRVAKIKTADRHLLEKFIFNLLNNKDLNPRLLELGSKIPFGISKEAIGFVQYFSYTTLHHSQFIRVATKAEKLVKQLDHPDNIADHEKLSLREFGILNQLATISPLLASLKEANILKDESYLARLHDKSVKAQKLVEDLNDRFQKTVGRDDHYHEGDISAWHTAKWEEFLAQKPSSEIEHMKTWATQLGHGSYFLREQASETSEFRPLRQTHLHGKYENEPVNIQHAAFSEVWRLQVPRLVDRSSPVYQTLKELYQTEGKDADQEIQRYYEKAAHQLHQKANQEKFADLKEDESRPLDLRKEDYGLKGSHRRWFGRDDHFAKVHAQFAYGPKNKKKMIASEFVTKATVAALIEADIQLTKIVQEHAKKNPSNQKLAALAEKLKSDPQQGLNLIHLPYDEKERLKQVDPQRMIDLLAKKNCIVKVDPPPPSPSCI